MPHLHWIAEVLRWHTYQLTATCLLAEFAVYLNVSTRLFSETGVKQKWTRRTLPSILDSRPVVLCDKVHQRVEKPACRITTKERDELARMALNTSVTGPQNI